MVAGFGSTFAGSLIGWVFGSFVVGAQVVYAVVKADILGVLKTNCSGYDFTGLEGYGRVNFGGLRVGHGAFGYGVGNLLEGRGYVGGLIGSMSTGTLSNNFSAALISGGGNTGGLIGSVNYEDIFEGSNYLDGIRSESDCDWCVVVNTEEEPDSDYFFNNTFNPPFGDGEGGVSSWEFPDIWHTRLSDYPTLTPLDEQQMQCEELIVTSTTAQIVCDVIPEGYGITTWVMQYSVLGSDDWQNVTLEDAHHAHATISGLSSGTEYRVRFRYTNDEGTGPWGHIDALTTGSPSSSDGSGGDVPIIVAKRASANVTYVTETDDVIIVDDTKETKIVLNDFAEFFGEGKQLKLKLNQVIYFMVGSQEHSATVKEIGTDYVIVTLASTPKDVRIELQQTVRHDVTDDGQDDVLITLSGISNGLADLSFKSLSSNTIPPAVNQTESSRNVQFAVILIVLGLALILIKRRKKQTKDSRDN